MEKTQQIAVVTSDGSPKDGQKHRSSNNFEIKIPEGTKYLKFGVEMVNSASSVNPDMVRFDVMHDKSGSDSTWWDNSYNGKQSADHIEDCDSLYIADPFNNQEQSFIVKVYAVLP